MSTKNEEEKEKVKHLPYMELTGSLLYAALATRPEISHSVSEICRYMSCYGEKHWNAAKRVLRYLVGAPTEGINYFPSHFDPGLILIEAFSDSDWAGDINDRKSTTGFVIKVDECTVTWQTKKQPIVSLSSAEAEYIAIADTAKEVLWIKNLLSELTQAEAVIECTIYIDNQSANTMTASPTIKEKSKHIDTRYHFIRDLVKTKQIRLVWIPTGEQIADIFTNSLGQVKFDYFTKNILGIKA